MWQDKVLAIVSVGFTLALLPQIIRCMKYGAFQISMWSALLTTIGLIVTAITLWSLKCRLAGAANIVTACEWLLLGLMHSFKSKENEQ